MYSIVYTYIISSANVVSLQYGDSYTEDVTEEDLRAIFKKMDEKVIMIRFSFLFSSLFVRISSIQETFPSPGKR